MRIPCFSFLALAALLGLSQLATAQGPPPGGPGGPGGGRPMNPVLRILDADNDGELSAAEMEKAPAALKALDRNSDGKLTDDELRPTPPGGGPGGGPGGRGPGGPGGGPGDQGGPAPTSAEVIARYMSLDVNKDGKLTKDEVPERLQGFFARADADNDENVTKDELTKMAERQTTPAGRSGPGGPGGPGGGGRGPGGPGGFGGNGGFGAGGGGFGAGGGFGGGGGPAGGGAPGGGPGRGGPPSPQAFMERAMEFDADKDGKLSKEELTKLAEQMAAGRGGPPREGRPPAQQ